MFVGETMVRIRTLHFLYGRSIQGNAHEFAFRRTSWCVAAKRSIRIQAKPTGSSTGMKWRLCSTDGRKREEHANCRCRSGRSSPSPWRRPENNSPGLPVAETADFAPFGAISSVRNRSGARKYLADPLIAKHIARHAVGEASVASKHRVVSEERHAGSHLDSSRSGFPSQVPSAWWELEAVSDATE